MPGGLGGEDIWKVSVDGDTYGTPENLGANVNTEANESFHRFKMIMFYFSRQTEDRALEGTMFSNKIPIPMKKLQMLANQ